MINKIKKSMKSIGVRGLAFAILAFVMPTMSYAVSYSSFNGTMQIIGGIKNIVNVLTPITGALALLYFFWGLAQFILHADNEDKREEGKQIMKWGIVALFVIVSIWGIVGFIQTEIFGTLQYPGDHKIPGFQLP